MFKPLLVTIAFVLSTAAAAQIRPDTPEHVFGASQPVTDHYIVVLRDDIAQPASIREQLTQQASGELTGSYRATIRGFSARMRPEAARALSRHPNVAFVEQDQTISLNEYAIQPPLAQPAATWGIDRVDQRVLPLNATYRYEYTGAGVYAFVIDTGIFATHVEFGSRVNVGAGFTAIADGRGTSDCNGHGTHVAGTLGGATYGIAKGVTLVPIRVLDCNGSGQFSSVIAGIDHAVKSGLRPAVINLSLGGGKSSAVNSAVASAVSRGIVVVVAAGNSNANACNYSPSSEPSAITVGATTSSDARASYSNYGSCLDIFAPGSAITSAWHTSDFAINTISGTSMASPHAAGVAALLLADNASSAQAVVTALSNNATSGKVTGAGTGSPNRLLFSVESEVGTAGLQPVAISSIAGSGRLVSSRSWAAQATVTIKAHDGFNFGAGVSGATVTGTFSPGGNSSCVTGSTGSCTLTSSNIRRTYTSTTFTANAISGSGLVYDSTKNASTRTTISRP